MSKMKTATACQRDLRDELPLFDVFVLNDPCVQVVRVLAMFSTSVHSISFTHEVVLERLVFPPTADVVLIYRDKVNHQCCDQRLLPNTLKNFFLYMVLAGENVTDTVNFRWKFKIHSNFGTL